MREAVIVSTARTGIGRAYKGSLNNTKSPTMAGHAISHAVARTGIDPAEIEDVIIGTAMPGGTAGMNVARSALLAAGLPAAVAGQTIDRQCASGLMAVATAAKQIIVDGMDVVVAGGQESISLVQEPFVKWVASDADPALKQRVPHAYISMLETAEIVSRKYRISREAQDAYAAESQRRTAAAQKQGLLNAEIVPISVQMAITDKETGALSYREVVLDRDEGNRQETSLESLAQVRTAVPGGVITGGNASQLSDGASACVLMERSRPLPCRGKAPEVSCRVARPGCVP